MLAPESTERYRADHDLPPGSIRRAPHTRIEDDDGEAGWHNPVDDVTDRSPDPSYTAEVRDMVAFVYRHAETDYERRVLDLIQDGLSEREIAKATQTERHQVRAAKDGVRARAMEVLRGKK